MSERSGAGFGAFLFGIVLGAGGGIRVRTHRRRRKHAPQGDEGLRNLKELAEEKVDEVRGLLQEAEEDAEESEEEEEEEPEITTREQLRRRLEAARRRRARASRPPVPPAAEEEDEPLA